MSDLSSPTPPSLSPSSLTPQSTGTQDSSPGAAKKSRPQAAFYPNVNASNKPQKPFSRSAAKRESVMALGSIEHLQHYFTKTGIAAKKECVWATSQRKGLVPAIGGLQGHLRNNSSLSSLPEFELPPSPALPAQHRPAFPPYVKTFETDPENLRPGVIQDLSAVEQVWTLDRSDHQQDPGLLGADNHASDRFDILHVLKTTTHAIRSVRNYLLSLPDDTVDTKRQPYRPMTMSPGEMPKRRVSQPDDRSNPITLIRRSALEVLTILRALEESSRVPLSDEAYDAQSDHASNQGSHSRVASPSGLLYDDPDTTLDLDADTSFAISLVQVQGRRDSVLVWDEEEDEFQQPPDEERDPRERWDERLVLGSGWLYKQDVKLEHLVKERETLGRYLDAVDEVLFGGRKGGVRGWQREHERLERKERLDREARAKGRRTGTPLPDPDRDGTAGSVRRIASTGILDAMQDLSVLDERDPLGFVGEEDEEGTLSIDDDELPQWAKRSAFADDALARAHALLVALLPANLLSHIGSTPERGNLLQVLSSGQLLCVAYNAGVRRSRKPWGYISRDAIHDIVALEAAQLSASAAPPEDKEKESARSKGWTFRRTDNLRLWAAALRLRYLLPVVSPAPPETLLRSPSGDTGTPLTSPSPSKTRFPTSEPPVYFDARVVARRDDGWEDMLEQTLERWVQVVVDERRGDSRMTSA
ncbi:hypothetical protein FA95DRAFT_1533516 [Auriscalpium vulgare]|uniref:Uncharacterized protein n=1 Tax=Auriscalpium vulgare TaxID=40419 RepID=A0ACB8S7W1_9AGAM|nr:hypothetical protein FA95DRAFT_1533516 [Auriscalpium vulgare]